MVVLKNTGGWSDRLADSFFDNRKRRMIIGANSAEEAVALAIQEANQKINKTEKSVQFIKERK